MNSRQENRSNLSFYSQNYNKILFGTLFLSVYGEQISTKGFLKLCKLVSKLILDQIIVSDLKTIVHKLASQTALDFMKLDTEKTNTYTVCNNYSGLPFEMQLLKAIR